MSSTLTPPDCQHFAQLLRERVPVLRAEIRDTLLRADAERYADLAGRMQDAQDHGLAELLADVSHAEVERDLSELRDIEGALHRIAAGNYGQCIQCAAPIPRGRLEAWPTAKRCLPCQQQHEQARQRAAGS
jgi:DnaK suppressor protein